HDPRGDGAGSQRTGPGHDPLCGVPEVIPGRRLDRARPDAGFAGARLAGRRPLHRCDGVAGCPGGGGRVDHGPAAVDLRPEPPGRSVCAAGLWHRPAPELTMFGSSLDIPLVLVLLLNFFSLGTSRLRSLVYAVACQGVILGLLPLLAHRGLT